MSDEQGNIKVGKLKLTIVGSKNLIEKIEREFPDLLEKLRKEHPGLHAKLTAAETEKSLQCPACGHLLAPPDPNRRAEETHCPSCGHPFEEEPV